MKCYGELAYNHKVESLNSSIKLDLDAIDFLAYAILTDVSSSVDNKNRAKSISKLVSEIKKVIE